MSDYILYDERGVFEPDEANVLEVFGATSDADAFGQTVKQWPEHGWALHRDGDTLIAWSSPKRKSIVRWFAEWDKPRQFNYKGKRQKLFVGRRTDGGKNV